jgi:alpha-L-arabinofuranosidase
MHQVDSSIKLIGWGDGDGWSAKVMDAAGEDLEHIAFHCHFDAPEFIAKNGHRLDPAKAWELLMGIIDFPEKRVSEMREEVKGYSITLAITEGHFTMPSRNRGDVLSTWAAGVADARVMHIYERNSDLIKIATLADFCGNRWQVNALMIPTPSYRKTYMMPVARIMQLYRKHVGEKTLDVTNAPDGLDIAASRTGDRIFLHVVNTSMTKSVETQFDLSGLKITGGKVFEIADEPFREVSEYEPDVFLTKEHTLPKDNRWTFPAASVSAVELNIRNS